MVGKRPKECDLSACSGYKLCLHLKEGLAIHKCRHTLGGRRCDGPYGAARQRFIFLEARRVIIKLQQIQYVLAGIVFICASAGMTTSSAMAQQHVFPKKGQSQEQQSRDEYQCHQWASQKSGFDPTKAPPPAAAAPAPAQPRHARNALGGAARGYVFGKVVDGDSNKSAKAGAVVGVMRGARRNRAQAQQQQAQQQAQAGGQQSYLRARATCLDAKGYSVG